jgi:hypothetical protein
MAGIRCVRWRGQPEEFLLTTPSSKKWPATRSRWSRGIVWPFAGLRGAESDQTSDTPVGEDDYQHVAKLIEAATERVTIPTDKRSPLA